MTYKTKKSVKKALFFCFRSVLFWHGKCIYGLVAHGEQPNNHIRRKIK